MQYILSSDDWPCRNKTKNVSIVSTITAWSVAKFHLISNLRLITQILFCHCSVTKVSFNQQCKINYTDTFLSLFNHIGFI